MGGVSWNHLMVGEAECLTESPPLWVAWVEMFWNAEKRGLAESRRPYGWRELKSLNGRRSWMSFRVAALMGGVSWNWNNLNLTCRLGGRHPYGWRELKFIISSAFFAWISSPPTWVVWVEIFATPASTPLTSTSPPTWVVWVEIYQHEQQEHKYQVATHMGGVSWNLNLWAYYKSCTVATHMGGVSWNQTRKTATMPIAMSPPLWVAWVEITAQRDNS